jgi:hypothetical protein
MAPGVVGLIVTVFLTGLKDFTCGVVAEIEDGVTVIFVSNGNPVWI